MSVQELLTELRPRGATGVDLEVFGKQAAADWSRGRYANLSEAVSAQVKHASLSREHVRRVIEFANTEAFNLEFRKQGAAHRVVSFAGGPADPSTILKEMEGTGSGHYTRGVSDYLNAPEHAKVSSARAEQAFTDMFKAAEVDYPWDNPFGDAIDLRDKLATVYEQLSQEMSHLELLRDDLQDRVYQEVKQAALEGASLADVLQVWGEVAPTPGEEYIKAAFAYMAPRLLRESVFSTPSALGRSLDEKTASHRPVNQGHPLVHSFQNFCESIAKLAESRAARQTLAADLAELTGFLKKQASLEAAAPAAERTLESIVKEKGLLGAGAGAYKKLVNHAGTAAHGLGTFAFGEGGKAGPRASQAVRAVGNYGIPLVGAGLAYNAITQSQPYAVAKDLLGGAIPGSGQNFNNQGMYY